MNAELAVGPRFQRQPAAALGQGAERLDRVFVAVLGVNGFAGTKLDRRVTHSDGLSLRAGKMHFDAAAFAVVEGVMLKGIEIEISAKLAIDTREQVEVEFGGDAFGVIVSAVENIRGFDEIDADNEDRTVAKNPRRVAKETRRFMRFKIADGRAGKEAGARPLRGFRRRLKHSGEVGGHGVNRKVRKVAAQPGRFLLKKIAGYIDRHIGLDAGRRAQKDACLGARSAAEFDKH